VVDERGEVLALVDGLEAPGDADAALERRDEHVEIAAELVHGGDRAEGVRDVESAAQRRGDLALTGGRAEREGNPAEAHAQVARAVVGALVDGDGDGTSDLVGEPRSGGAADVDDAHPRPMPGGA